MTLAEFLRAAKKLVVFTGAGVSTESGIPDFRGPGGLWEKHTPVLYEDFLVSREARIAYWNQRRLIYPVMLTAKPNAAHLAIAALARSGRMVGLITQNIDGLHHASGVPGNQIAELHGTNTRTRCLDCEAVELASRTWERLQAGEGELRCPQCGGIQKPDTISFGQALDPAVLDLATKWAKTCDAMLVVGSSLVVEPAASLPRFAVVAGAKLAIINAQPTPLDHLAAVVSHARAGEVLPAAVSESAIPKGI